MIRVVHPGSLFLKKWYIMYLHISKMFVCVKRERAEASVRYVSTFILFLNLFIFLRVCVYSVTTVARA
jgi:hypothetical protein